MARGNSHSTHRNAIRGTLGRGGRRQFGRNVVEDGNRAQSTYRRRYRNEDASALRSPPRGRRLIDRMTFDNGGGQQGNTAVRGPRLAERITYDDDSGRGRERATPVQGRHINANSVNSNTTGNAVGPVTGTYANIGGQDTQGSSLFCTQGGQPFQATQPFPGTQTSQSALHSRPITISATPAVTPALRSRIKPCASIPPISVTNHPVNHRGNTYKGKDPIKLAVQNPKLRAILAGRRPRGPPKKHNDPVLRMGLKDKGVNDL